MNNMMIIMIMKNPTHMMITIPEKGRDGIIMTMIRIDMMNNMIIMKVIKNRTHMMMITIPEKGRDGSDDQQF